MLIENNSVVYFSNEDYAVVKQCGQFGFQVVEMLGGIKSVFYVEVDIVDYDPIIGVFDMYVQRFFMSSVHLENTLIGRIEIIPYLLDSCDHVTFRNNQHNLKFELLDFVRSPKFRLNTNTGLLFTSEHLDSIPPAFYNLNVKVTGRIGHRNVIVLINVVVIVKSDENIRHIETSSYSQIINRKLNITMSKNQRTAIMLPSSIFNISTNQRFKLINQVDSCEVNWLNGHVYCREFNNEEQIVMHIMMYQNIANGFKINEYIQVIF